MMKTFWCLAWSPPGAAAACCCPPPHFRSDPQISPLIINTSPHSHTQFVSTTSGIIVNKFLLYCELDLMTRLKGTKLLPRVAWLAGDCFVQLIVIATLTMEQELVSALCSEYTIIPSYTPRPPHYRHLLPTAAAAALSYRHLSEVWQCSTGEYIPQRRL